ncbi:unnamed protein product, partial [Closterium sp. NIES-64]
VVFVRQRLGFIRLALLVDSKVVFVRQRLGFIRLALQHGVPVLPCFAFGQVGGGWGAPGAHPFPGGGTHTVALHSAPTLTSPPVQSLMAPLPPTFLPFLSPSLPSCPSLASPRPCQCKLVPPLFLLPFSSFHPVPSRAMVPCCTRTHLYSHFPHLSSSSSCSTSSQPPSFPSPLPSLPPPPFPSPLSPLFPSPHPSDLCIPSPILLPPLVFHTSPPLVHPSPRPPLTPEHSVGGGEPWHHAASAPTVASPPAPYASSSSHFTPAFPFSLFALPEGEWFRWVARRIGFAPMLFWGMWGSPIPFRTPLTIVIGTPIGQGDPDPNPSKERVAAVHAEYVRALERLFLDYRAQAGYPTTELEIM